MKYRKIGKSNLQVSAIGLGCNNFGFIANLDVEASRKVIDRAIDSGITFFDTSDSYGTSENILGEVLGARRKDIVLATKFGARTNALGEKSGASRAYLLAEAEESLRRLRTDWIDLYQIHYPDPKTPIEETLRGLHDLVKSGKVRHIGCSNFSPSQLQEAQSTAAAKGLTALVSSQDEYSLLVRKLEREQSPLIESYGMGELPYFPLASGLLTGKYRKGQTAPKGTRLGENRLNLTDRFHSEANLEKVERLESFARQGGHSMLELAFSWLLSRPAVASVIAGATRPEQIEANAKAGDWNLSAAELAEVDSITGVPSPQMA
ncbi:MAG TPA: aldo/keto reductase [Candidatus Binatia bacterium]|nr:aldo/keto reductase [Candidatus Binatia bacterium]